MAKDKLALVAQVMAMKRDKEQLALRASAAAVAAKRADIHQLETMQGDYLNQITDWQSGQPKGLQDRFSMYGNLTTMLAHLEQELAQLQRMEERCADQLRRSRQQLEGLEKLQTQRAQAQALQRKRAERRQ